MESRWEESLLPSNLLNLFPDFGAWILRVESRQFTKQFFSLLVPWHRYDYLYFYNFVTASPIPGSGWHAFLPQPEFLAGLCPRWNFQQSATVDCGHLDLRAQCG